MNADTNVFHNVLPKEKRKNIFLLCDDIRTHSGIGTIAREIVLGTVHRFNWFNLGGAQRHPDEGKEIDFSQEAARMSGVSDAQVFIYPVSGYGNQPLIRHFISSKKFDAMFIFTDPRYWVWLFHMEREIRSKMPLVYLNIWDDGPVPRWNREFYRSCDLIMNISKQTYSLVKRCVHDSENVVSLHSSERRVDLVSLNEITTFV